MRFTFAAAVIAASFPMFGSTAASAAARCACRTSEGVKVEYGQTACLHLSGGDQLARCETVLNNTSWKKLQDGCPTSRVQTRMSSKGS